MASKTEEPQGGTLQPGTPFIDPYELHSANMEAQILAGYRSIRDEELIEGLAYARAIMGDRLVLPITMWELLPNGKVRATIRHMKGHFLLDMRESTFRSLPRLKSKEG